MTKPHYGKLLNYHKDHDGCTGIGLQYRVTGISQGHPYWDGRWITTAPILSREGNEIETANARYTLVDVNDNDQEML